jgi:DNA-binding GntR family transcriptional regulator
MKTEESVYPKRPNGSRFNLSDDIFLVIRKKILTREIRPGERMNIDSLSRDLNVSQTPIREALARLEETGLVLKEPLKGFKASQLLTNKEAQDLFKFREVVEPFAAHLAARHATDEQARLLEEEVERSREISKIGGVSAFEALADHDEKLHNLIFEIADNGLLSKAYKSTHCFLHLYRLHFIRDVPVDFQDTLDEHCLIIKAIQDKSADQARNAMIDHIENARKRFQYPAI